MKKVTRNDLVLKVFWDIETKKSFSPILSSLDIRRLFRQDENLSKFNFTKRQINASISSCVYHKFLQIVKDDTKEKFNTRYVITQKGKFKIRAVISGYWRCVCNNLGIDYKNREI